MIARLFRQDKARRAQRAAPRIAAVPAGERVYAVGDVHGRADLLRDLIARIEADDAARAPARTTIVFLGDLVDRGPDSAGVIDQVLALRDSGRAVRVIAGNHEEVFQKAVAGDVRATRFFLRIGGRETILSYPITLGDYEALDHDALAARLPALIPPAHVAFLNTLEDTIVIGDYLFVHAGIRPGEAVEKQKRSDLRWIRDEFLDDPRDHGKIVVHGHTICDAVEELANRIGIDTGAYCNGRLTAIGLEGTSRWYLEACGAAVPDARMAGARG